MFILFSRDDDAHMFRYALFFYIGDNLANVPKQLKLHPELKKQVEIHEKIASLPVNQSQKRIIKLETIADDAF